MSPAKKRGKSRAKSIVKSPKVVDEKARLRKKPKYKSFYLHESIKHPGPRLPSALKIGQKAFRLLAANARPLTWFVVVYGLLSLVFVSGVVSPINIDEVRFRLEEQTGQDSSFTNNITILGLMLTSSLRASGDVSALYQLLFIITSVLALIWLYRQQQAGTKVSIKDAYYRGMYPLVPFVAIVLLMFIQILPAAVGNALYGQVVASGLAVTGVEQLFWFLFFLLLILLSLYFISSSLIALFVVTLPEMTPLAALREARLMVAHRRMSVLLRVVSVILLMIVMYIAIVFPAIFVSAALAQVFFFLLTILAIPFATAYLFVLYRELL